MNLDLIQSKLNSFSSNKGGNQKSNDKALKFWKPSVGKSIVRFVPSKLNAENPFQEIYFHYGIGKRTIISPINFGEKDPIVEFTKELRKTKEPENWKLAKKLEPKMRVFAPVIVRGEEDKGVRMWEFGKEIYQSLLSLAADEDIGDFTDILEGRDIKIETSGPDQNGTAYNKSKVLPALKVTSLTEDKKQLDLWLKDQPDIFSFYKKYEFDEIKGFLAEWLNPENTENQNETPEPSKQNESNDLFDGPATQFEPTGFKLESVKSNQISSKKKETLDSSEFDDLFGDNN
jgi:hypothetical protein